LCLYSKPSVVLFVKLWYQSWDWRLFKSWVTNSVLTAELAEPLKNDLY
jgi:hypothetical protein